MKFIVGLGNIGNEYQGTRHNVGLSTIDMLADKLNMHFKLETKFKGLIAQGNIDGEKVILLKPTTFMNLSGEAVISVLNFYKIDIKDMIVICDDLDMEVGKIRFRTKGSAGGHNGLKNIILHTGSEVFDRIKIGISRDKFIPVVDWVLGHFSKDDQIKMDQAFERASECLKDYICLHKDIQHLALDLTK
jgi:PTH1 family peptidyl-tRNA hydrolase